MRAAVLLSLCLLALPAFAQDQESKLLDRLLKPDMTLANAAQDKQFSGVRNTTARPVVTHEFGGTHETVTKEYGGQRGFFARLFGHTRNFPEQSTAAMTTRNNVPQKTFRTHVSPVRESSDSAKVVATADYSGERQFLARGKSQKSLDQQRHQMSIDEVRELLNRNK